MKDEQSESEALSMDHDEDMFAGDASSDDDNPLTSINKAFDTVAARLDTRQARFEENITRMIMPPQSYASVAKPVRMAASQTPTQITILANAMLALLHARVEDMESHVQGSVVIPTGDPFSTQSTDLSRGCEFGLDQERRVMQRERLTLEEDTLCILKNSPKLEFGSLDLCKGQQKHSAECFTWQQLKMIARLSALVLTATSF
ncbi:hypothetical protein PPACK8108_LOCUS9261 [Phakopsora pachyrhizi]|uniref:Uncharacterized protein n=1 Tax=Phakopsora pachyrhizi TaxID=170000 RepID=A0AAV0AY78_PHAPC|nr:hypothetical protein PPACK8108_LOCUS9261 [Phakopsora pachyrhizi]